MRPTEILEAEHRVIEQVLSCLERMATIGTEAGRIDADPAREAIDFLRNFADRCHHGKEEAQLFPAMESRGFSPENGPTAVMRYEHTVGRKLIGQMDDAVEQASQGSAEHVRVFAHSAREYVGMLREHIRKEDHCLFPMADQALDEAAQQELLRMFERVEHEDIGAGVHERYLALADELAERYGVARKAVASCGGCGCGGH